VSKQIFKVEKVRRPLPFKDWQEKISTKECQVSEAKRVTFNVKVKEEAEESEMKFSFKTFFKYATDVNNSGESDENKSQSDVHMHKYSIDDLSAQKETNSLLEKIDIAFGECFEDMSDISRESSECKMLMTIGDEEFDIDHQMSGKAVFGEMWALYYMNIQETKPNLFERLRRRVNRYQDGER